MPSTFKEVNNLPLPAAAEWYARHGFRIFPLLPGDKRPMVGSWPARATCNMAQVKYWWSQWPNANIGWAMGQNWHALDVDRKGGDGVGSLALLDVTTPYPWPIQRTPSQGMHFIWQGDYKLANFARRGEKGGLDMRTDHGYIAVAPSRLSGIAAPYTWEKEGDPTVPPPPKLREQCEKNWSSYARERSLEHFPIPEVPLASETDARARIAALGDPHYAFLEGLPVPAEDRSRAAYHACRAAFIAGWTLEDMAAIGPWTTLATFGADPPHSASDPWRWCWRYTVNAAWAAQRNAPGDGAQTNQQEQGRLDSSRQLYQTLHDKSQLLAQHDYHAFRSFVQEVLLSGLQPSEQQALFAAARPVAGYNREITKQILDELRTQTSPERDVNDEVYVRDQGRFYSPRSGALITREAFIHAMAREHGGSKPDAEEVWLTGPQARCPVVESLTYDPGLPPGVTLLDTLVPVYNTYRTSRIAGGSGTGRACGPWLELLRALRLEEGEKAQEWLLDRLAWVLQRPGEKINHGILLGGDFGIGKDSFLSPFLDCVGRHNVKTIAGHELGSDFSDYARCKVIVINEMAWGSDKQGRAVAEKMKPILAAPPTELRINEKHLRPYSVPNRVQCIAMSNHRQALHAEEGERRWLMLWADLRIDPSMRAQWDDWFAGYWQWLRDGGTEEVMAFLSARDVSHFQPGARPPVTAWLEETIMTGDDGLAFWLSEQIQQRAGPFEAAELTLESIMTWAHSGAQSHYLPRKLDRGTMVKALRQIGVIQVRKGGARRRFWKVRSDGVDWKEGERIAHQTIIDARKRFLYDKGKPRPGENPASP